MANTWGASGTTWGQNTWGKQSDVTLTLTGFEMSTGLGEEGWGRSTWGNDAWGQGNTVDIEIGHPVTGFEITASLGAPQINYDFTVTLTDSLLGTLSLGSLTTIPDMAIGVSGYAITGSLGTPIEEMKYPITGYSATMSLGTIAVTSNPLVVISGFAITGSLGSLGAIDDMQIGVSGYSITGSLGTTTVTDMQVGISGIEITGTLNALVSPLHYKDDTITGSTSYTSVDITGSTSYTVDTHAA